MVEPITLDFLRNLYRNVGLAPSDEELSALLPVVQSFYDGAPQVEGILRREDEPRITFQLPSLS
jgi:hypothetical protein